MEYIYDLRKMMEYSAGYFGHAVTKDGKLACLQVDALLAIAERLEALVEVLAKLRGGE